MCGIFGVISQSKNIRELLVRAELIQNHRGPDYQGTYHCEIKSWQIGLGHQRLSILDLSELGNQPMVSYSKNSYIVFNGEIYNYLEIRQELKSLGYSFHSDSDTEVLITSLEHWGIETTISKLNGMWSFAWLNLKTQKLILCRDRIGIKPLYYSIVDKCLYFASEVKTILEVSNRRFAINFQVVGEYLLQSLLESNNQSFFQGIDKIDPGTYAVFDLSQDNLQLTLKRYWSIKRQEVKFNSETEIIEKVRELFFDAVRLRLRSDVPVGVLLSGGVDSSAIAAVVQNILGKDVNLSLLSSVSNDPRFDESYFIDIMGGHLGKEVNKVTLDLQPGRAFELLEKACWHNDQPIGGFSNVAHFLLMEQAKNLGITVILSGQGADELLCGYRKYTGFYLQYLAREKQYVRMFKTLAAFITNKTIINQFSFADAKRYLPNLFFNRQEINISGFALKDFVSQPLGLSMGMTVVDRQVSDIERFSVPALLHYEDRMSMAWSREIRVPFLDYRLVDMLSNLPIELKLRSGWTKYIFRRAISPFLPQEIAWRKDKQGFINPESQWLKSSLKAEVLNYFEEDSLIFKHQIIDRNKLIEKYNNYCQINNNSVAYRDIFNPLSLEIWLRKYQTYISS
ncbi:asparagine synthase (glutamine-hydrolyzing) [Sphaerospermopsis sp. LEGE 08334]|uniref:asparagine synthase (glutamine-hydrolyzing) n=1 Tax=Sphaerospermopsis sp. LEGE 08334 TaxID=1828651 RepID=UPI00187DE25B|nr:asparagine synthase (glutamine-hydrolyzing) [Sphaerospermopsis sp. LEGE 08334]MBE9059134.1 asparagine synthase (glutamine-hydrolyzing) [Sphaerospermopsis sp. LEGE 08334]